MLNQSLVDPASQKRYKKQFFKTSMCVYYLENACRKGDSCTHAHSADELQSKPVLSKTRMCKQVLRNGNCPDRACSFAHEIGELIQANTFFRTKMCEFHVTETGCKLGDKCRYAHSETQLNTLTSDLYMEANESAAPTIPAVDFNDSPDTGYPMKKRGSMGSRATMASSSYASLGNFASLQPTVPVPIVYVYPSSYAPYFINGSAESYSD
jgi:hypothetical protein